LLVDVKALWHQGGEVIFRTRHRDVQQAALLFGQSQHDPLGADPRLRSNAD
jgi:hypothetical protein